MEITKREVLSSVSIIAVMLIIGFIIGGKIQDYQNDQNAIYYKAMKIKDHDIFKYSMDTDVGNAFVYGDLKAQDPVSFDDVKGEYLEIKRVKEKYTMHTRTVTYTDSKGKTRTKTETYWTWDTIGVENKKASKVNFLGVDFDSSKFNIPSKSYIDTISDGYNLRSQYYGYPKESKITIFTSLKDGTISNNSSTYKDNIDNTLEDLTSGAELVLFWIIWIVLIIAAVALFYKAENRWLE